MRREEFFEAINFTWDKFFTHAVFKGPFTASAICYTEVLRLALSL
jgi:hypothetical protein